MKARNIVIAVAVTASITAGAVYAAYHYASRSRTVNVVQVSNVNQDYWDYDDDVIYGEIISRNVQKVMLNTSYSLSKVYVEEGDSVKIGDPLLEYDMTMVQLQRDSEDLNNQILQLQEQQSQRQIDKVLSRYSNARAVYEKILQDESELRAEMETISLAPETMTELSQDDIEAAQGGAAGSDSDTDGAGDDLSDISGDEDTDQDTARLDESGSGSRSFTSGAAGLDTSETMVKTSSADELIVDDSQETVIADDSQGTVSDNGSSSAGSYADSTLLDSSDLSSGGSVQPEQSDDSLIADDQESGSDAPSSGADGTAGNLSTGDIVNVNGQDNDFGLSSDDAQNASDIGADPDNLVVEDSTETQTDPNNAVQIDTGDISEAESEGTDLTQYDEAIISNVRDFLTMESVIRSEYTDDPSSVSPEDIAKAMTLFQDRLSSVPSAGAGTLLSFTDVLAENRQVSLYLLGPAVLSSLQGLEEATSVSFSAQESAISLYRAYGNVLYFHLTEQMNALGSAMASIGADAQTLTEDQALTLKDYIRNALDAYYLFEYNWAQIKAVLAQSYGVSEQTLQVIDEGYNQVIRSYTGENLQLDDRTQGTLSIAAALLRDAQVIVETETEPHSETESEFPTELPDDNGGGDDPESMTNDELKQTLVEYRSNLLETQLQIRESDLKLDDYDRQLGGQVVRSQLNGVVRSAGTVDEQVTDEAFITVAGENGMYVRANISELALKNIAIGDEVSGTDTNGNSFSASITEISPYPASSDSYYGWGWSSDNTNVSNYPFLAYIEDAEGLEEGDAQMNFVSENSGTSSSIVLDSYYVRNDGTGRPYVYVADENGRLQQRYIKTGKSYYGQAIEVVSGLSMDDYIAFPYGRDVKDGTPVKVVDSLESDYYG